MESGESGSWSTPLPYLSICEAIFSAVRRLSLVFYKVVTKVALIFTLASSWQSARQENIVPSVLSEPASRSASKRSQPTRAGPLARRGRAWMRTQEISYSQSEEFTVSEIRASATHARARGERLRIRVTHRGSDFYRDTSPPSPSLSLSLSLSLSFSDFRLRKHKLNSRFQSGTSETRGGGQRGSDEFCISKNDTSGRFACAFNVFNEPCCAMPLQLDFLTRFERVIPAKKSSLGFQRPLPLLDDSSALCRRCATVTTK